MFTLSILKYTFLYTLNERYVLFIKEFIRIIKGIFLF
nr:MAG TPA: hypothetical protein [Caudoviricetes sp.]